MGRAVAQRKFDNIPARNEIAAKLMQENGVAPTISTRHRFP